jgi:hypothetical protein
VWAIIPGAISSDSCWARRLFTTLVRYIHLNPVKAGLVEHPGDWEFSNYQEYVELRQGTLPKFGVVRGQVGSAQDYRTFVEVENVLQPAIKHLMLDE